MSKLVSANSQLKKVGGGAIAPQHYNPNTNEFEIVYGSDGASHVKIQPDAQDVILQNAATIAGNGTPFAPTNSNYTLTFEIVGTSTSRTVLFELAGPSGRYMPITAFSVTDPTKFNIQTTGGSDSSPESWQVVIPAGYTFRTRISAVAGGNVMIKGKAVT